MINNNIVDDLTEFLSRPDTEGKSNTFYLDRKGQITIGFGHYSNDSKSFFSLMPILHSSINFEVKATDQEVKNEWDRMQSLQNTFKNKYAKTAAQAYAKGAFVRISDDDAKALLKQDIQDSIEYMKKYFPSIIEAPYSAQKALLDMCFNMGAKRTSEKFQKLSDAINHHDWQKAAQESHRKDISETRNQQIKSWFLEAANETGNNSAQIAPQAKASNQTIPLEQSRFYLKKGSVTVNTLPYSPGTNGPGIIPKPVGSNNKNNQLPQQIDAKEITSDQSSVRKPKLSISFQPALQSQLLVYKFYGDEGISQLFSYHVVTYSHDTDIKPEQILFKSATLQINDSLGTPVRYFNGIVKKLAKGEVRDGWRQYTIELMPALEQLAYVSDCRIFHQKTAVDIIKLLLADYDIKINTSRLTKKLPERLYCVQYRETSLNFILRLLEEEGIFYFFQQDKDSHTLVLADDISGYTSNAKIKLAYDHSHSAASLLSWERGQSYYGFDQRDVDYNYEKPSDDLRVQSNKKPKLPAASGMIFSDYAGGFTDVDQGQLIVNRRAEAEEAWHDIADGSSCHLNLTAAGCFTLENVFDKNQSGDYVIVAIEHFATDTTHVKSNESTHFDYSNHFSVLPKTVAAIPKRHTPKPIIHGCQTAVVVGDGQANQEASLHPDLCVQVRFFWDENATSRWVRVAQPSAGKNFGMAFHPRINQEVLVVFENGDPDRPLIIGNLYNQDNAVPYPLPDNRYRNGIKTQSAPNATSAQFNELYFDDNQGAEKIYWHAQKDFERLIENDEDVTIKLGDHTTDVQAGESSLKAAQAIEFIVGSNSLLLNTQGIFINGQEVRVRRS